MIRLGKNIRTMVVLLAGLVILSHSLIPHHHHYNSCFNDNYGAQGEIPCNDESSDKADTHCHAFNTILSEKSDSTYFGNKAVWHFFLFFVPVPETQYVASLIELPAFIIPYIVSFKNYFSSGLSFRGPPFLA